MRKETFVINEWEHKPHIMTANSINAAIMTNDLGMDEQPPLHPITISRVLAEPLADFRVLHQSQNWNFLKCPTDRQPFIRHFIILF